jgi:hypothetical protein
MAAKIVARLTLVVEYEDIPDAREIEEVLDSARNYGGVKRATFETLELVKKELV